MTRAALDRSVPEGDRVLLDTTALAAYLDAREPTHPVIRYLMDEFIARGRNEAVISMITVMEILVRPLRSAPGGYHTVLAFVRDHPHLQAIPLDLQMAQEAASLRATHRLSAPDALVIGTGVATQVGQLVTNDHAWSKKLAPIRDRIRVLTLDRFLPFP
jgi:predicted nucleic acid-binding protein